MSRQWAASLLDTFLPSLCPLCHIAAGPDLCPTCCAELPRIDDPCSWCGAPDAALRTCPSCAGRGLRGIARVHVSYHYHGACERLVSLAKAAGRPAAVRAAANLVTAHPHGDLVVPIPATPGRRSGPHLATAIARHVAATLGIPCRAALHQTRRPRAQHSLSAAERARNVDDLFRADPVPESVILVDDLLTSGATAESAARALRQQGAKRIALVCLARTPNDAERPRKEPL
jgi:predicted amidophosphoribosyltransferase